MAHERIVDLHIHSHYSRATSQNMNISSLYRWGKIKGIHIMGTGDFTHPGYFKELQEKLEPAEEGLFRLKKKFAAEEDKLVPASCRDNPSRFVLSVEISCIYSKGGRVRKLHNLVILPSFAAAEKLNTALGKVGNLKADGRPILGLDSLELLKMALDADEQALFIPAHIWTPWFGMFGSKSGFDALEEAFGDLRTHIYGVETGLSSDPYMNWRVKQLDGVTMISNSDAHSAEKLGREANVLSCDLSFSEMYKAIKTGDTRFVGTIEFFPQEGKYHYDGHRTCGVRFNPAETKKHQGRCPVCGLPLVVGVDYRVGELADRGENYKPKKHKAVEYIIPLSEMIAETKGVKNSNAKSVKEEYAALVSAFGDEFTLLRSTPVEAIRAGGFPEMAEAMRRLRAGNVFIEPGYDGVFGVVKVFKPDEEISKVSGQLSMI